MIDSRTLNVSQILGFKNPEKFERFVPIDNEQVWFNLMDRKTKEIVNTKAMTLNDADKKNKVIRDTNYAWVRA
jgi:hypothetical protein